jgi:hypothetical protein
MIKSGKLRAWAASLAVIVLAAAGGAAAQRAGGLTQKQIDELANKHDGYYGALAPQNLNKKRPKAPFDLTGTWFVDLRKSFLDFQFGPPYPEFYAAGQQAMKDAAAARAANKPYRDSIGECYPAGMPMIMTRVWNIAIIQKPTAIYMIANFMNSVRIIYLDGRKFSNPDIVVPSYNGESIGHWEGRTLVVHSKYFEPNEHWIDGGLPISDQFEMTEKISLLDKGHTLQIEYVMTDPKNWKGEWRSTKRWLRQDWSDVYEVECLPNLNKHLPSTEEGQEAIKEREAAPAKPQ